MRERERERRALMLVEVGGSGMVVQTTSCQRHWQRLVVGGCVVLFIFNFFRLVKQKENN